MKNKKLGRTKIIEPGVLKITIDKKAYAKHKKQRESKLIFHLLNLMQ